jgi:hypothetical protein
VKRTATAADQPSNEPGDREGRYEREEAKHEWELSRRDDVAMPPIAHDATLGAHQGTSPPAREHRASSLQLRRTCVSPSRATVPSTRKVDGRHRTSSAGATSSIADMPRDIRESDP